jgi:hypothetical protein
MIGLIGLAGNELSPEGKGQRQRTHTNQEDKGLDYRIGLSGAVSKPPCGALINDKVLSDKVKASSYSLVGVVIVWYGYRS